MNGMDVLVRHINRVWGIGLVCLLPGTLSADEIVANRSLGALEYRAILGQALVQRVDELMQKRETLENELTEVRAQLSEARRLLDQSQKEQDTLRYTLAERDRELEEQNHLLSVFRNSSFEYYEVRSGDTLHSIAANPMVYGDAGRVVWLKQANALDESDRLIPGSIIIIPRFPDGVIHDL